MIHCLHFTVFAYTAPEKKQARSRFTIYPSNTTAWMLIVIISLSNYDGDGNENVSKQ